MPSTLDRKNQASTPATSAGKAKDDPSWAPERGDKPDAAQPQDERRASSGGATTSPQRNPAGDNTRR